MVLPGGSTLLLEYGPSPGGFRQPQGIMHGSRRPSSGGLLIIGSNILCGSVWVPIARLLVIVLMGPNGAGKLVEMKSTTNVVFGYEVPVGTTVV